MILSKSGLVYETRLESFELGEVTIELESLADIDKTIDDLFGIYQREGRTDLFEEMCPYFGTLWPAGKVLALYLADGNLRNELTSESRILEIGCGLALPSLFLSKIGQTVEATDMHPDVPCFLDKNRTRNGVTGPAFLSLDWRDPPGRQWDLILASDVLYDKIQPKAVLQFLKSALAPEGRCLLADPGRSYFQGFLEEAIKSGFRVKTEGLFGVLIGELARDVVL